MNNGLYLNAFGNYWTKTFSDIFPDVAKFIAFLGTTSKNGECGIQPVLNETMTSTLYYLLYAKHGNDIIENFDENQFKYKLASIVYINGASWAKKREIQDTINSLKLTITKNGKTYPNPDIFVGATQIYNHSYNPATAPSTDTIDELTTLNEQNTSKNKRGLLEGINLLMSLIEDDITSSFLSKFDKLFNPVVAAQAPLLYSTEIEEESE